MTDGHERCRASIDAHFAGRSRLEREREMRAHVADCARCRDYYERHLLLSELDPKAFGPEPRLSRGLGLAPPRRAAWGALGAALAGAAALALWLAPPRPAPLGSELMARGAPVGRDSALDVYRIAPGGAPEPAPTSIQRSDELAFAYAGSSKHYLLVFGVDEHRHVYWYHPAWTDAGSDPVARAISTEPGIHELSEAVSQGLDGRSLELVGLFTDQPLSVRTVERVVTEDAGKAPVAALLRARFAGSEVSERTLKVEP